MYEFPLVSIIVTSYNQIERVSRAFNSIIHQTYQNLEIIIVDDASTDSVSQLFIKSLAKQYPSVVHYYLQPSNVGIAKNKNTGFRMTKGQYITYLDGDDYYFPEKIEYEVKAFLADPTLDVVYSNYTLQDITGQTIVTWNECESPPEGFIFKEVISRSFPHNMLYRCEMFKADILKKIGYYDESIAAYHDWDARIRYSKFCKLKYIDYVGSAYVQNPAGISKTKTPQFLLRELNQVFEKNRPLLLDLPKAEQRKVELLLQVKMLKGQIIHSDTQRSFWKSIYHYLLLKPRDIAFLLRQVYARTKKLLLQ